MAFSSTSFNDVVYYGLYYYASESGESAVLPEPLRPALVIIPSLVNRLIS